MISRISQSWRERQRIHYNMAYITLHNIQTRHTASSLTAFEPLQRRRKWKHDYVIFYLEASERLWGFVFRKLVVWLWTEHTVSVADAKLAQPQGGIKCVSTLVLRLNWGQRLTLIGLIQFLSWYSHRLLVVREALVVPEKEIGRLEWFILLKNVCFFFVFLKSVQRSIWSGFKMTEESFCVLVGIKKYGGLLWKRRYSSDCTQGSHHDWTHNPRPHISCSPLSFCKHLKRPKVHCHRILGVVFFFSCRKTICYVLADIKLCLRALVSA